MPMDRRTFTSLLTTSVLPLAASAQSAEWPTRPVRVIAPAPPGGSLDRLTRMLCEDLAKSLGQPFVVDNRPGAGGTIGSAFAASAPADGYTVLMSGVFNAIAPSLFAKLPYSYLDDFVHIAPTFHGPNVLVTRAESPYTSLAKLVSAARGTAIDYASAGTGTSGHLTMALLQRAGGLQLTHVPYKGSAPAMQDVLGGQVPVIATNQDAVLPLVKSGKLRALAVTGAQRNPAFPGVPTFAESGFPEVVVVSWGAVAVRKGTPAIVVERLRAATLRALKSPQLRQPLEADGWEFFDSQAGQFDAFAKTETERWAQIVRAAGIRPE